MDLKFPALHSPRTTQKQHSWYESAKSSVKALLSPSRSRPRHRRSIVGLYDTFRGRTLPRPSVASPSKNTSLSVKRRKSFSHILSRHKSQSFSPDELSARGCCISTARPKTPDEYLQELVRSFEDKDSNDVESEFRAQSESRDTSGYIGIIGVENSIERNIELTVAEMIRIRHYYDPEKLVRAGLTNQQSEQTAENVCLSLKYEKLWKTIAIGENFMTRLADNWKPKPYRKLKDIPSNEDLRNSSDSLDLCLEQSVGLRTPPVADLPKVLPSKLLPSTQQISTAAVSVKYPAIENQPSYLQIFNTRTEAIEDIYDKGQHLAEYIDWDSARKIFETCPIGSIVPTDAASSSIQQFRLPLHSWPGTTRMIPVSEPCNQSQQFTDRVPSESSKAKLSADEIDLTLEEDPDMSQGFWESDLSGSLSRLPIHLKDIVRSESVHSSWYAPSHNDLADVEPIPTWMTLQKARRRRTSELSDPVEQSDFDSLESDLAETLETSSINRANEMELDVEANQQLDYCLDRVSSGSPNVFCDFNKTNAASEITFDLDDCLRAIAAEDALSNLRDCHSILEALDAESCRDPTLPQFMDYNRSSRSSNASAVSLPSGFKFSVHGNILLNC